MERKTILRWALAASLGVAVIAVLIVASFFAPGGREGTPGMYPVTVTGPDGPVFSGTVDVAQPTALGALDAASTAGGFTYTTERYPQFGCGIYVSSVDGQAEEGAHGWVYEIERDGQRSRPSVASCAFSLRPGDAVHWVWGTT